VVFLHDLRHTPRVWEPWTALFERAGYVAIAPPWPPTWAAFADGAAELVQMLNSRPAIVGHGRGAVVAEALAGEGLSAATVAIAPGPVDAAPQRPAGRAGRPLLIITGADGPGPLRTDDAAAIEVISRPGAGAALIAGPGWREVAETALTFIQRFV
jgi:hypothetical protein